VLQYSDDSEALSQDHEYLLGDELLVAPVVEEGVTTRRVYLPEGGWYDFWDDAIHEEQGYHELPAPLDRIPLFVRSGAILPLLSEPTETLTDMAPEQLFAGVRLLVYPRHRVGSAPSEFRFHDGSGVLLSEGEGRLRLTLEGTTPERRYTVRLPRASAHLSLAVPNFSVLEFHAHDVPFFHGLAE
jgi:alpha-glucosidase (family GH31 glycosyl hydrolase)